MATRILSLAVVMVLVLLVSISCSGSPTSPSGGGGPLPWPELPPGSQWSVVGPLQVSPVSAPVGTYISIWFNSTGPKAFCHEYVKRITKPDGITDIGLRSMRFCSTGTKTGYGSDFKADMPGRFGIAVEMYEYDGDQLRPDSPVMVRGEANVY